MVRHQNIAANPPAILFGRALPDFAQNFFAFCRGQNFASPICAGRKENNWVVAERGQMCQMPKTWRRPALGPHTWRHPTAARGRTGSSRARGRTGSIFDLVPHSELFGARILTPSRSSCVRNSRANSTAPGVSPWTQIVSPRTSTSRPSTERTLPSDNIRNTR
jgi:hypothetical protein